MLTRSGVLGRGHLEGDSPVKLRREGRTEGAFCISNGGWACSGDAVVGSGMGSVMTCCSTDVFLPVLGNASQFLTPLL